MGIFKAVIDELLQYREIGTLEECRRTHENQIPKKPSYVDESYGIFECPNCKEMIYATDEMQSHKYCLSCGQALDWSAIEPEPLEDSDGEN